MKTLDSKLPKVGTTIFTLMSQLAEQHRAVNLSQGFPDFRPPAGLLELVERVLSERYHQYALMPGSIRFTVIVWLPRPANARLSPTVAEFGAVQFAAS